MLISRAGWAHKEIDDLYSYVETTGSVKPPTNSAYENPTQQTLNPKSIDIQLVASLQTISGAPPDRPEITIGVNSSSNKPSDPTVASGEEVLATYQRHPICALAHEVDASIPPQ
ncbi:hypothetical protein RRF57_011739 [Xylaria bambusicola]|uniref:Uncharacterized protein n=1 Tax=Xylaria bambusicola TaxID=326684 RepID=A0AAN7UU68_9PEZI